jgi:hypothetical protein
VSIIAIASRKPERESGTTSTNGGSSSNCAHCIVSEVAPVNALRAIELFKSFRRFARVFTKIGADRKNGPYKCSPQSEALDSLAECLIVQRLIGFFYGFLDGILMTSISSRMEHNPALADE